MGTISVINLGKAYKQYPKRVSRLLDWLIPWSKPHHTLKWILKDISFTVNPGESLGIIGFNGAGKSTLLKLITGTTQATTGTVELTGRVAALLELGMGFHADFTGRQNAFMVGQLLGYSAEEITKLMPEIEAFAEIGDYIDQQVRVYSSGMQMRLAFSVATAIRPDVLIIDEALSVGDAYFQHKSFERISQFRKLGTTLLLVSHDKGAIQAICDRAILLHTGQIVRDGLPEAVMDYYNAMLANDQNQKIVQETTASGVTHTVSGTGEANIEELTLLNASFKPIEIVDVGEKVFIRAIVKASTRIDRLVLGYGIKDRLGQVMYGTNTHLKKQAIEAVEPGARIEFLIEFSMNLGPGTYSIQTALVSTETHLENNYEWRDGALVFNVANINKSHFAGSAWLDPQIKIRNL